ncbi:hypothetical protein LEP1GSC008_1190 [Leptospira kirschneri serovar Bulgarica str. Nikolaevo]|uniref:Uncharacterized protein n=1 Tax=Leptospira kirschneri serovar Bulgarica str. Nikolaevo TaxID=1240687 RepID=M6FHK7_9LEPT|nr:hypothetical protein LEP1GSC008_1190 [Leptospira kirschneri serovar Bulgarica str. Nikolaevo]
MVIIFCFPNIFFIDCLFYFLNGEETPLAASRGCIFSKLEILHLVSFPGNS